VEEQALSSSPLDVYIQECEQVGKLAQRFVKTFKTAGGTSLWTMLAQVKGYPQGNAQTSFYPESGYIRKARPPTWVNHR
jgi:hypothetical protein